MTEETETARSASEGEVPLLELVHLRLQLASNATLPELTASAHGPCVALVGDWTPLFRLLAGEAHVSGGAAKILGTPARVAIRQGLVGLALQDPPLPRAWTAEAYLSESGRLLGWPKRHALQRARELLGRFELTHLARRTLASLPGVERRALLIAHAALAEPDVVCIEAPLDRLEGDAAAYVDLRLQRALEGRRGIVHVPSLAGVGLERALIDRANSVLTLAHGHVLSSAVAESTGSGRVLVTVARRAAAFRTQLESRGVGVQSLGYFAALLPALVTPDGAELERFLVTLPEPPDTRTILEASRAAEAPLLELRSLQDD